MMNIAVAQSGGPTCAINASLVGVFKESLKVPQIDAIFGSVNGIEGIIENHLVDLKSMILTNNDMELLKQTPSTVLGSCRYKLPDWHDDEEVYKKIAETLKQRNIGAFFYIGGNDSMDTVNKLSEYFAEQSIDIKVIGIPKTIDNDLCITDHTPGFGSAAKYVATTMHEITRDSIVYSIPSVTIVEIMGRHAGWLTASSAVLHAMGETAPHLIYVPEVKFSLESFLTDVRQKCPSIRLLSLLFPRVSKSLRAFSQALLTISATSTSQVSASTLKTLYAARSAARFARSSSTLCRDVLHISAQRQISTKLRLSVPQVYAVHSKEKQAR